MALAVCWAAVAIVVWVYLGYPVVLGLAASNAGEAESTVLLRAQDEVEAAIGELRELARGIHPTLLGSRGMAWDEAERTLAGWQPLAGRHDFAAGWDEAAQVAGETRGFLFLTDSVPQPYRAPPKIGRNDPCPCGSGQKYKKCCGRARPS